MTLDTFVSKELDNWSPPWPDELPINPNYWTRKLECHFNFGSDGGSATYSICDEEGAETPIRYGYIDKKSVKKKHPLWRLNGFSLPNWEIEGKPFLSWRELREQWPIWVAHQRGIATLELPK